DGIRDFHVTGVQTCALPIYYNAAEKSLIQSVQASYNIVLFNLYLFAKVARYTLNEETKRKSKHLPTAEDLNFSTKLSDNLFTHSIEKNELFKDALKERKLNNADVDELVKALFRILFEHQDYKIYTITEGHQFENDKHIIKTLYRDVMLNNPLYDAHMEEMFQNWADDFSLA